MTSDRQERQGGNEPGPFSALDSKLNIFALANGMDLVKEPTHRLLGWYRDGMERGILVEPAAGGTLSVTALCWKTHHFDEARRDPQRTAVDTETLVAELSKVLEDALEAANAL